VLIDWFTVVAQIVNFLVLVALMKHFLYGRLVRAMDEREKRIAGQLAEAEQKSHDAEQRLEQIHVRTLEQERQRNEMMAQAQRDADLQRNQMVQDARESVRKLETKWHEDMERERKAFLEEFQRRAAGEILVTVRRALMDLAGSDLQSCAIQVFLEKLRCFDVTVLGNLVKGELTVLSACELPEETRGQILQVLENRVARPVHLRFELAPEIAWGIELRGNGWRMGWSADSYIESLTESLEEAIAH